MNKNIVNKILQLLLSFVSLFVTIPFLLPIYAGDGDPARMCELSSIIVSGFNMLIAIFPLVGLGVLIFGSYLWATAGSDPQKIERSKKTLTTGVIGLVLGLSAIVIIGTLQMILIGDDKFKWISDEGILRVDFCLSDYQSSP